MSVCVRAGTGIPCPCTLASHLAQRFPLRVGGVNARHADEWGRSNEEELQASLSPSLSPPPSPSLYYILTLDVFLQSLSLRSILARSVDHLASYLGSILARSVDHLASYLNVGFETLRRIWTSSVPLLFCYQSNLKGYLHTFVVEENNETQQ